MFVTSACRSAVCSPCGHAWNTYFPFIRTGLSSAIMEPDGFSLILYMLCWAGSTSAQASRAVATTPVRFLIVDLLGRLKRITRPFLTGVGLGMMIGHTGGRMSTIKVAITLDEDLLERRSEE